MSYFVTGATGWVGGAVVAELLAGGHEVVGLVRSDANAATLRAQGARVLQADMQDLDVLAAAAAGSDGVVHTAFDHSFTDMAAAARKDRAIIDAIGEALAGSGKPFVISSGLAGLSQGQPALESDLGSEQNPRTANEMAVVALADRGVRSVSVRLAPTVHGEGDHGFVPRIVAAAREHGRSVWVGDGQTRWSAVHRLDAAHLYVLALGGVPAGTRLHAAAEEGIPFRAIAEAVGTGLDVPVAGVDADEAAQVLGFLGMFAAIDMPASSAATRALTGWSPTGPTLLEDLAGPHYFA